MKTQVILYSFYFILKHSHFMSTISSQIDITRTHDLAIDEIKECKLFAHLSDEEAQTVIDTLKALSLIAFECVENDKKVNTVL